MTNIDAEHEEEYEIHIPPWWSWQYWPIRLVYCLAAGTAVNLTIGVYAFGTVITVVLFVLTSAILATRRD